MAARLNRDAPTELYIFKFSNGLLKIGVSFVTEDRLSRFIGKVFEHEGVVLTGKVKETFLFASRAEAENMEKFLHKKYSEFNRRPYSNKVHGFSELFHDFLGNSSLSDHNNMNGNIQVYDPFIVCKDIKFSTDKLLVKLKEVMCKRNKVLIPTHHLKSLVTNLMITANKGAQYKLHFIKANSVRLRSGQLATIFKFFTGFPAASILSLLDIPLEPVNLNRITLTALAKTCPYNFLEGKSYLSVKNSISYGYLLDNEPTWATCSLRKAISLRGFDIKLFKR